MKITLRLFIDGQQRHEWPAIDAEEYHPAFVAFLLANREMLESTRHVFEIEFLDEPEPMLRFFRWGTEPGGMVFPIAVRYADQN